jgi:hypothetical protein
LNWKSRITKISNTLAIIPTLRCPKLSV